MKFSHQQIVLNRYRVTHSLGAGTMGEVYLARQIALDREVAIKVLRDTQSKESIQRFEQEAHILAQLRHPHIVSILDYGVLADQSPCIIMEYIDGYSLGHLLTRHGTLPWHEAIEIMLPIAEGLLALHTQQFVHRDLKPDNVLLTRTKPQEVKLVDFGVARNLSRDQSDKITRAGALVGTPAYMSPEQLFGEEATPRSDLYALGVILFELLTGQIPDNPRGMKDLRKRLTAKVIAPIPPPHQPPLPDALVRLLIEDLLPADPTRRLPGVRQLIDKLNALLEQPALGSESSTQVWDRDAVPMLEQTTAAEDLPFTLDSEGSIPFEAEHTPAQNRPELKIQGVILRKPSLESE